MTKSKLVKASALIMLGFVAGCIFSQKAKAAPHYVIKAGSIVCFYEADYDAQMKALGQGYEKTVDNCGIAGRDIPVIVIHQNMFSASEVQAVDGGTRLFVGIESIGVKK
jgi:hypothetical protein